MDFLKDFLADKVNEAFIAKDPNAFITLLGGCLFIASALFTVSSVFCAAIKSTYSKVTGIFKFKPSELYTQIITYMAKHEPKWNEIQEGSPLGGYLDYPELKFKVLHDNTILHVFTYPEGEDIRGKLTNKELAKLTKFILNKKKEILKAQEDKNLDKLTRKFYKLNKKEANTPQSNTSPGEAAALNVELALKTGAISVEEANVALANLQRSIANLPPISFPDNGHGHSPSFPVYQAHSPLYEPKEVSPTILKMNEHKNNKEKGKGA